MPTMPSQVKEISILGSDGKPLKPPPEQQQLPLEIQNFIETRINTTVDVARDTMRRDVDAAKNELSRVASETRKDSKVRSWIQFGVGSFAAILIAIAGWRFGYGEVRELTEKYVKDHMNEPEFDRIAQMVISNRAGDFVVERLIPLAEDVALLRTNINQANESLDRKIAGLDTSVKRSQVAESNIQAVLTDAKETLRRLGEDSDFVSKVLLAETDDRAAYEELRRQANNSSFRNANLARSVTDVVQGSYVGPFRRAWQQVPWAEAASNRYSWGIDSINSSWAQIKGNHAKDYLRFVWGHTNLTKEQRVSFLRNAYLRDSRNSLQAADFAAETVSKEFGAEYNPPFDYSRVENLWREYSNTNHLFTLPAMVPTNMTYEIIVSSSTNSAMVLTNWGETKLILFKLSYAAVPGSIDAMYISHYNSSIEKMKFGGSHLNTLWAKFNKWDDGVKCEVKYERDLSGTNVQAIGFTNNTLMIDGSPRDTFP